jgi:hypothetical protein
MEPSMAKFLKYGIREVPAPTLNGRTGRESQTLQSGLFERAVRSKQDGGNEYARTDRTNPPGRLVAAFGPAGRLIGDGDRRDARSRCRFNAFKRADFGISRPAKARMGRCDRRNDSGEQGQKGKDDAVHRRAV